MNTCIRNGCSIKFDKKIHNQKYCSDECCQIATRQKMLQKYYDKRDRKKGKKRWCDTCKVTELSRYNETHTCASCLNEKKKKAKDSVLSMIDKVVLTNL